MAKSFTIQVIINAKNNAMAALKSFRDGFAGALNVPTSLNQAMEVLGTGLANVVNQIPQLVGEMTQLGIASQGAERRFTQFAGSSDRAADLLGAFNKATDGTVDKITAMTSAGRLLQMGLVQTTDEMANVASIAVKLGNQTLSASDRISDFSLLLANQSIPRLDNFGISSGKVRKRIKELQASIKDLSREEAFKIAVMEEGRRSLEILGDTSDLTSVKIDKLNAAVTDAKIGFGELIVSLLDTVGGVDELAARIRQLPETVSQITMLFNAYGEAVKFAGGNIFKFGQALEVFDETLRDSVKEQLLAEEVTRALASATERGFDRVRDFTRATDEQVSSAKVAIAILRDNTSESEFFTLATGEIRRSVDKASDAFEIYQSALRQTEIAQAQSAMATVELREEQEKAVLATQASIQSQLDLAQSLKGASEARIASAAISELKTALDEGQISFDEYSTAVGEVQLTFGLADEASVNLSKRMLALVDRFGEGTIGAESFDDELERLIELNEAENIQLEKFGEILTISTEIIGGGIEAEEKFAVAEIESTVAVEDNADAIDMQRQEMEGMITTIGELTTDTEILSERIGELSKFLDELPEKKTIKIEVNIESSGAFPGNVGVPEFQHGGSFVGAGIVGEGGQPELVFAPGGATVTPLNRITNNNFNMTVNAQGSPAGGIIDEFEVMQALAS